MNTFQERLNFLLAKHKLSHVALAQKLNINSSAIDNYFRKNYYPALDIAINMAKFFDCSLNYLFGLTDNPTPKYTFTTSKMAENFWSNFSKTLQAHKLPIERAMKLLNMSKTNYYRWKNGQLPITSNIVRIAEYFDISVDYLLGHE